MKRYSKKAAIDLFGSTEDFAKALGITRQRVSQIPDRLTNKYNDRVIGAAVRKGKLHLVEQDEA